MQQRQLGPDGPMVGAVGLGCMSFAGFFGACDETSALNTLAKAWDLGITHLDTAKLYGDGLSEQIIGRFLKDNPRDFKIATKGGIKTKPTRSFDNSKDYLTECLEGSLKRLGVDYVDLYYVHRRDHSIPIEDVVGTLVRFKEQGKIGAFGFSEIAPYSLERAHAIHPVAAVQNEYSLWTRQPELGMLQLCKRLGTSFVPFSPVARGVLTDVTLDPPNFDDTDFRKSNPRFMEPHFSTNMEKIATFKSYAHDKGYSTAALAIAWVLHQDKACIPIPGTRTANHLEQCAKGADITLTEDELADIEQILPVGFAHGYRYSAEQKGVVEDYC